MFFIRIIRVRFIVLVLSILLFLLFVFPVYYIFFPSSDFVFTGVHTGLNALDSFFQLEVVQQGAASSSWLAENMYSAELPAVQRFLIFYTALGKLSNLLGLPWIVAYQIVRAIGVLGFVWVLYWFIGLFRPDSKSSLFILVLTLFSGSLWQVYWPEGSVFLSLYNPPHVVFALGLMLLVLGNYLRRHFALSSLCLFLLGWIHPYDAMALLIVLLFFTIYNCCLNKNFTEFKDYVIWCIGGLLPLIFHFIWSYNQIMPRGISLDDIWMPLWSLPVFLGINFFTAIAGIRWQTNKKSESSYDLRLLYIWFFAGLVMLYLPVYFRRKLFLGVPIALNILAGGLIWDLTKCYFSSILLKRARVIFLISYLILASWTTVLLIGHDLSGFYKQEFPYFVSREVMDSYNYFSRLGSKHNFLTHPRNGIYLPVYSGQKVYTSDWLWTEDKERKVKEVTQFFTGSTSNEWRKDFLSKHRIDYIYYGDKEQALGNFSPQKCNYLERVFKNSSAEVYRVYSE